MSVNSVVNVFFWLVDLRGTLKRIFKRRFLSVNIVGSVFVI